MRKLMWSKGMLLVVAMLAASMFFSVNSFADDPVNNNEIGIGIDATNNNTALGGAANSAATGGAADVKIGDITNTNANDNKNVNGNTNTNDNKNVNGNTNILNGAGGGKGGDASGQTTTVGGTTVGGQTTNVGGQTVNMNTPRPFLAAPGFVTGIIPGMVENNREWKLFCPSLGAFSAKKIHRMKAKSSFFGSNSDIEVTEIEESRTPVESLTCQMAWPATYDDVGAEVVVSGNINSTQAAAVGSAMAECVDRGFPAIAMVVVDKFEGETKGRSLGLSSAVATVANTSGVAFVGGGMLGTNRTRSNDYKMVRAMCLTSLMMRVEEKKVVVVETKKRCDTTKDLLDIAQAVDKITTCYRYCYDNMSDRFKAALGSLNVFACTRDIAYLNDAIKHYEMAELNYIHGFDIRNHADSNAIIAEVEYGLASAIYARDGSIANFWQAPDTVVHEDKKNGADKPVRLTPAEKEKVLELRRTLEKFSKHLIPN